MTAAEQTLLSETQGVEWTVCREVEKISLQFYKFCFLLFFCYFRLTVLTFRAAFPGLVDGVDTWRRGTICN